MTGKEKCELLKKIRKEIADRNGIAFEPAKCTLVNPHCPGTCPRCDEEIRYLDAQLNKKAEMGGRIAIAGLSPEVLREIDRPKPLFGDKPSRIPDFYPWNRNEEEREGLQGQMVSRPPSHIYQTQGLIRSPEIDCPDETNIPWDEEDEDD